jgi:hypothetical protein
MAATSKAKAKGRKIGHTKNKPCQQRYTQSKRWEKNKLRRAKIMANKFGHAIKIKFDGVIEMIRPDKGKEKIKEEK